MRLLRYLSQYRFRDMGELIRNDKRKPLGVDGGLEGKTVVLSGATSGIGKAAALHFAEKRANLVLLNRSPEKSKSLEQECRDRFGASVRTFIVNFSSLGQTRKCCEDLLNMREPIDILIHNAGVFSTRRRFSEDNLELVFQVNHLSSFLINVMLKEKIKNENRARILYVNSEGHRFALGGVHLNDLRWKRHIYTGLRSYGAAKTAQLLTMRKFRDYFADSSVTINAMHPGNVLSNMGENNGRFYRMMKRQFILPGAKDTAISAQALHYLAASGDMNGISGRFFNLTTPEKPAPHARDETAVDPVWQTSLELCGLS